MLKDQFKKGTALTYLSIVLLNATQLIITPLIISSLGKSNYGVYNLIGALVANISLLDFGLTNTVTRYVSKYKALNDKKSEENLLANVLIIYGVLSAVCVVVGGIIYFNMQAIFPKLIGEEIQLAKKLLVVLILNISLSLPLNMFLSCIFAYEKFVLTKTVNIIKICVRCAVLFALLLLGYKALAIVLLDSVCNIGVLLFNLVYCKYKLKIRIKLHEFSLKYIYKIFKFSFWLFVIMTVEILYLKTGSLLAGGMIGAGEVAVFSFAATIVNYYIQFASAIPSLILPKFTKMAVEKKASEYDRLIIKAGRINFIILALIFTGFIFFGKMFVDIFAGEGFSQAYILSIIMMAPMTVFLSENCYAIVLQAQNRHKAYAIIYFLSAAVNIVLSFVLMKVYGISGAALAFCVCVAFLVLGLNIYYYKEGFNVKGFFKDVFILLKAVLPAAGVGVLISLIPGERVIMFLVKGLLYLIVYLLFIWGIGLNKDEKQSVKKFF